jgi:C-terminal processing protease CtpA/Prc
MDSARLREGTERTNEEKNGENTRATVGIALQTVAAGKVFIAAVRRGGPAAHAVPPLLVRLCTDVFAAVMSVFLLLFAGVQAFRTWLSARDLTRSALTKVGDMLLSVGDTMCDESVSSQTILQLLEGPAGSSIAISVCGESDVKDVVLQRVPEHELGRGWLYPMPEKFGVL